jgi:hypothetical protein
MTEYFKQIVDAWGDRLRSPVLGSILIFFVATNWQSLFYLFFADKPVRARLLYFEANTDGWSLYGTPVIGGVILAIAVPWVSLAGAFLARFPRAILHEVQSSEALKRRIVVYRLKADEEEAKASVEEARERSKIDAAKRLNEAENVSAELKTEIEEEREKVETPPELNPIELEVLNFAAETSAGTFMETDGAIWEDSTENPNKIISLGESHREQMLLKNTLSNLIHHGLLREIKGLNGVGFYEITLRGYSALDFYNAESLKQPDPTDHTRPLPPPRP